MKQSEAQLALGLLFCLISKSEIHWALSAAAAVMGALHAASAAYLALNKK